MSNAKPPAPVGRTRWRRFGVAAGAGFGLVAVLLFLVSSGALALNFAISGIPFSLHADSLTGQHFVQYAVPDRLANNTEGLLEPQAGNLLNIPNPDNVRPAAGAFWASDSVTQFRTATITGLNQTICAPVTSIPGLGTIRVHLLGTGDTTASALTIQAPALKARVAEFSNINIGTTVRQGINAQDPGSDPYNAVPAGSALGDAFAQDASAATLTDIDQIGVGTEAGLFTVRGLQLWAEFANGCP